MRSEPASPLARFHGREPKLDFHKCLLLALSGRATRADEYLSGGEKRTLTNRLLPVSIYEFTP